MKLISLRRYTGIIIGCMAISACQSDDETSQDPINTYVPFSVSALPMPNDGYGYDDMLMFPLYRDDRSPHAAFVNLHKKKLSDLRKKIRKYSKRGYMVRARADVDTVEARQGDRGRWATVMNEGANIVVTDFIWPHPNFGHDYFVRINDPGVVARCSPLRLELCNAAN